MPWLVVDLALVLVAIVALGLTGLSLWRSVKGLSREVADAGTTVGEATEQLARLQAEVAERTPPAAPTATGAATPRHGRPSRVR